MIPRWQLRHVLILLLSPKHAAAFSKSFRILKPNLRKHLCHISNFPQASATATYVLSYPY